MCNRASRNLANASEQVSISLQSKDALHALSLLDNLLGHRFCQVIAKPTWCPALYVFPHVLVMCANLEPSCVLKINSDRVNMTRGHHQVDVIRQCRKQCQ